LTLIDFEIYMNKKQYESIMQKPKIGLLLMTAEWFSKIGAHEGPFQDLNDLLNADANSIEEILSKDLEVINPGVLATKKQIQSAIELFKIEQIDLLVLCQITWGEDRLIIEALQMMPNKPVLLWCYSPFKRLPEQLSMLDLFRGSGPVGSVQASGPLKRFGRKFGFAFGSYTDKNAIRKIVAFSRAAKVANDLKDVVIGVLPYRCDQMSGTYIDEFRLKREMGPELKYVSSHDYLESCKNVKVIEVEKFVDYLKNNFKIAKNTTNKGLMKSARASIGLAKLVKKYDFDALAIEDVGDELHRVVGLRPCLDYYDLFERSVVSMEADIGGAVALLILKMLTGKTPMYTEIFTFDESDNCILMGHAGIHNASSLVKNKEDIFIEPDGEYVESEPDSAWMRFRVREGQVTILSVFCDVERFKLVISKGEILGGKEKLLGSPHAYVKIDKPLGEFFENIIRSGMTQHFAIIHDEIVDELMSLADILNLDRLVL
jgi:L-arabinose isomerase